MARVVSAVGEWDSPKRARFLLFELCLLSEKFRDALDNRGRVINHFFRQRLQLLPTDEKEKPKEETEISWKPEVVEVDPSPVSGRKGDSTFSYSFRGRPRGRRLASNPS